MAESYQFGHWGSTREEILENHFPLHRACRDDDVDRLSLLLKQAQHGIYVEDSFYGWTPAHWAAYFGKLACLMKLLDKDMACDATTIRLNQTPCHIAAFAGQSHCLKWLIHCGAALDRQDYLKETAIHKAARTGSVECISLLVSHNARLYIKNSSGLRPAELAAACGHMECAQYLETACARQEHDAKGVFELASLPSACTVSPSPHDLTAHSVCNGGTVAELQQDVNVANGRDEECEMEEGEEPQETSAAPTPAFTQNISLSNIAQQLPDQVTQLNGHTHGDVMLDQGVSKNYVPVAGHKRTREETDETCHKRPRTQVTTTTWKDMTGFDPEVLAREDDDQVGYDYNGILQFSDKEMDQCLENAECKTDEMLNRSRKLIVQSPTNGFVNGHCIKNTASLNNESSGQAIQNTIEETAFGGNGMADCIPKSSCSSSSELEHQSTILVEQGYDSMFYDSFVSSPNHTDESF